MLHLQKSLVAAAAALVVAAPALASTTVYTSQADFLLALSGLGTYTESFAGIPTSPPTSYSNGTFSFDLSAPDGLYGDPSGFVGTNLPNQMLTMTFSSNVNAVGGFFFDTDINPSFQTDDITLTLADGTVESFAPASYDESFRGFISDAPIVSLTMSAPTRDGLYASVDDITVGVPEPATFGLAALAAFGLLAGRRRKSA